MSWFSFFKRNKTTFQHDSQQNHEDVVMSSAPVNDLEFVDISKTIFATNPVQLAKDVDVYSRSIVEAKGKKFTFPLCPGIWDYSRMGYIIPAWTDIRIKANKAGSIVLIGGNNKSTPFSNPYPMDFNIIDGYVNFNGTIPNAWNIPSPWKIFTKRKNISALLLPAFYHSSPEIFENLYIVPGVVDYDSFHVMNFICAIKNKCELTIRAGEPLLHFIPFVNSDIVCGYGPTSPEQEAECNYDPVVHQKQFYRKKQQIKKSYELNEEE